MRQLLIVEPEKDFASLIVDSLNGYADCVTVRTAQAAIDWLDVPGRRCDALVMELTLGAHSGVEVIHELRSHADWLALPVIVFTRLSRPANLTSEVLLSEYGVVDYLEKGRDSLVKLRESILAACHEAVHH